MMIRTRHLPATVLGPSFVLVLAGLLWPTFSRAADSAPSAPETLRAELEKKLKHPFKHHSAGVLALVTDSTDEIAATCVRHLYHLLPKMRQMAAFSKNAPPPPTLVIVLFKEQDDFTRFVKDRSGHSFGSYTYIHHKEPNRRIIAAYLLPHKPMLARLRHVAFNALFQAWIPDPPPWLNEGLAECMEDAVLQDKALVLGPARRHIKDLRERLLRGKQGKIIPLKKLIALESDKWRDRPFEHYAMAWGFCRYLLEDPLIKEAGLFSKVMASLAPTAKEKENINNAHKVFMDDEWELIERNWRSYIGKIPETPAADLFHKARNAIANESYDQALPLLDQAMLKDSEYERLYYFRAVVLTHQKNDKAAVEDLTKALTNFPEYHAARFLRGQCLARLGFPKRAKGDLEACLKTSYRSRAKRALDTLP